MHLFLWSIRYIIWKIKHLLLKDVVIVAYVDDVCIRSKSYECHKKSIKNVS